MVTAEHPALEQAETQLLLACSRTRLTAEDAARIDALLRAGVNWDQLLDAARRHRVTLLVHRSIKNAGIPAREIPRHEYLRDHSRAFAARNAFLVRELQRLLGCLDAENVPAITYKGPAIASLAYGDLSLREFNDLDILVRSTDVARVSAILRREGYESAQRYTPREQAHVLKQFKEHRFQSGLVVVEPHWSITARRFPFSIGYEALWRRSRNVSIAGGHFRVFGPEDFLLILCVTGAKSRWKRLELVCDVAETVAAFPDIDWAALDARASASGSQRILWLGLGLATDLLDAPVPESLVRRIHDDPHVQRLRRVIVKALFSVSKTTGDAKQRPARFSPLLMAMRERPSHRWLYLWRTLTTPTVLHLRRFPLPGWLWPLYSLLVPAHDYVAQPMARWLRGLGGGNHSPESLP